MTARPGKENPDRLPTCEGDIALLGALCLFLSALDHLIPKPLPFMRLGLANLPLLIALGIFSARNFFLLVFVKILGQALITGTLFSYVILFSFSGAFLSAVIMLSLRRLARSRVSLAGISIAGAFVSNAAQLALARFIVFGEGIRYLSPPFLTAGIISGGLLGFFAEQFSAQSEWLRQRRDGAASTGISADKIYAARDKMSAPLSADESARFVTPAVSPVTSPPSGTAVFFRRVLLFLSAAFFLLVPHLPVRAALFLLFWILAIAAGKKTRPLFTLAGIVTIMLCNLFPPFGKILLSAGPFVIAEGSLFRGLQRAVTMEGLVMFSKFALLPLPRLPGKTGNLVSNSFGILARMNELFFFEEKQTRNTHKNKSLIKRLDGLLCEVSGANPN